MNLPFDPTFRGEIREQQPQSHDLEIGFEYHGDESMVSQIIADVRLKLATGQHSPDTGFFLTACLLELVARTRLLNAISQQMTTEFEAEDDAQRNERLKQFVAVFMEFGEPQMAWLFRFRPSEYAQRMHAGRQQYQHTQQK